MNPLAELIHQPAQQRGCLGEQPAVAGPRSQAVYHPAQRVSLGGRIAINQAADGQDLKCPRHLALFLAGDLGQPHHPQAPGSHGFRGAQRHEQTQTAAQCRRVPAAHLRKHTSLL